MVQFAGSFNVTVHKAATSTSMQLLSPKQGSKRNLRSDSSKNKPVIASNPHRLPIFIQIRPPSVVDHDILGSKCPRSGITSGHAVPAICSVHLPGWNPRLCAVRALSGAFSRGDTPDPAAPGCGAGYCRCPINSLALPHRNPAHRNSHRREAWAKIRLCIG